MAVLVTLLAVVVALLVVLVAGLLRSHAEILRALHELGAGLDPDDEHRPAAPSASTPRFGIEERGAEDVAGVSPFGDAISVAVREVDHPSLLAFLTTGCTTCGDFWSAFADDRLRVPGDARIVIVTKGEEAESPPRLRKFAPLAVPVVMSSAAWDDYGVPVAPYFAFVDGGSGRVVGEGAANTWQQLAAMMSRSLEDAGLDHSGRRGRRSTGRARVARIDRDLSAAGIEPGHPSLYPSRGSRPTGRGDA